MQIDDETLMALADGELDPGRAAAVQAAVKADPDLQARLHRFVETRRLLAGLKPAQDSAEDPLAAMIRAAAKPAPAATAAVTPDAPGPAVKAVAAQPANLNRRPMLAAAAAIALAVVGLGWWQWPGGTVEGMPSAELAALNELHSGEVRGLEDGTQLNMIASFRGAEGQLCREYETVRDESLRSVLACREKDGWTQRFAAISQTREGTFQPASDESAIGAALEAVGAGEPLSPEDEAAALGGGAGGLPPQ